MLFKEIFRVIGFFLYFFALALVVPLGIGLYYELYADPSLHPHPNVNGSFLISIVIVLVLALLFSYIGRKAKGYIYRREGIATVVIIWFIIPALGALPFLISGTLKNPLQAYFEITSGFTTTGASILAAKKYDPVTHQEIPIQVIAEDVVPVHYSFYGTVDPVRDKKTNAIIYEGIEAVSPALLFWRSMTQWLGGGGIIVLFVAILPALGVGGKMLFHTEVTGPIKDSLTPRIKETAIQLWKIYCILTISQILMLMFTNPQIHLFDAIATTFSTISTGGFSEIGRASCRERVSSPV